MNSQRLFRDIEDGILILDRSGTVMELNPGGRKLLGVSEEIYGKKYAALIASDTEGYNDSFHQLLVDAVEDKHLVHRKKVPYVTPGGQKLILNASCSVLWNQEETEEEGVILTFSDITAEEQLQKKILAFAKVFIVILCCVSLWNYVYAVCSVSPIPVSTTVLSKILAGVSLIPAVYIAKGLNMTWQEAGLQFKGIGKVLLIDSIVTVLGAGLMIAAKFVILRAAPQFFPENVPFFRFDKYPVWEYFAYLASVLAQEFVSRGIVHEGMRRVIPGRYSEGLAILVSSLMFGALHIHAGIVYMLSAAVLLGVLGLVYRRQKTIWGLCIPHYVLGMLIGILDFVAY